MRRTAGLLAGCLAAVLVSGCGGSSSGGGGGGGALDGLAPPNGLSVVPAPAPPPGPPGAGPVGVPADADYFTDPVRVRVHDAADADLEAVDALLCALARARPESLLNAGPYQALLDPTLCAAGGDAATLGTPTGQSDGPVRYALWTVDATRASANAPVVARYWGPGEALGGAADAQLWAELAVSRAPSPGDPYGAFTLDYALLDAADPDPSAPRTLGRVATLDDGAIGFTLFERTGDVTAVPAVGESAALLQAHVRFDAATRLGSARVLSTRRSDPGTGDTGPLVREALVAFDDEQLLRSIDRGAPELFSRSAPTEHVRRATLFYADGATPGARVERERGFGFRTEEGAFGWIGDPGLWQPPALGVDDGDEVVRDVFGEVGEELRYTLARGAGKLYRLERARLDIDQALDEPFQWGERDTLTGDLALFLVTWDGASWVRTCSVDSTTYERTPIEPPLVIDPGEHPYLWLFSDRLGGPVAWQIDDPTGIATYARTLERDGLDRALFGTVLCLRPGVTAAEAERGDVFFPDAATPAAAWTFAFDAASHTLFSDLGAGPQPVGLGPGETPGSGPFTWGLRSGPLVADPSGLAEIWSVFALDTVWMFETGSNDWNLAWGAFDSLGAPAAFEAPLDLLYVHSTADDRNASAAFDGRAFRLRFAGPERLSGIPTVGADLDGDGNLDRYDPLIDLVDGVRLASPLGTLLFRAGELELRLPPDPSGTTGLELLSAGDLVLSDGADARVPSLGPAPAVAEPPRVIDGVLIGP